jgi:transposase
MNRDSGKFRGKRMTGGGRTEVRKMLFMPTLVAIQHNQPIRAFYERLVNAGKPKMTAIVACMRKLLTLVNLFVAKKRTLEAKNSLTTKTVATREADRNVRPPVKGQSQ